MFYNALGELVSQTDAKGQTTAMTYDKLGRMIGRNVDQGRSMGSDSIDFKKILRGQARIDLE